MKTIIAGSRGATFDDVLVAVEACPFKVEITGTISGTARGADTFGEWVATENGWPVARKPANWTAYGRRAGYLRNEDMAAQADALIAAWDGESRGTKHMIDIAEARGLQVFVFHYAWPFDAALEREAV